MTKEVAGVGFATLRMRDPSHRPEVSEFQTESMAKLIY